MKAKVLKFKEAPDKHFAAWDVKRRNAIGWEFYSPKQKADAIALKLDLQSAYSAFIYDPNPRDSFISVKVNGQYPRVKNHAALAQIEKHIEKLWAAVPNPTLGKKPYAKVRTGQGIIYRIPG